MVEWVDDFFLTRLPDQRSTEADFINLTEQCGVPWSLKKLRTVQRYLGLDWDFRQRAVAMPIDKLTACQSLLATWVKPKAPFTAQEGGWVSDSSFRIRPSYHLAEPNHTCPHNTLFPSSATRSDDWSPLHRARGAPR